MYTAYGDPIRVKSSPHNPFCHISWPIGDAVVLVAGQSFSRELIFEETGCFSEVDPGGGGSVPGNQNPSQILLVDSQSTK